MNEPTPLFDEATTENLVALNKMNSSQDAWSSPRWLKRQRDFLSESLEGKIPRPHSFRELLEFIEQPIEVVDYGGGSGWLLHALSFSGIKIQNYVNVENIDLHVSCSLNHLQYFFLVPNEVSSYKWDSNNLALYLNSVLQYFESDDDFFEVVNTINPKVVLIDDLTPSVTNQFFAYQKYYETKIPYRFVNQNALIDGMEARGYVLKRRFKFDRVISPAFCYDFERRKDLFSIGETNSLIFERA